LLDFHRLLPRFLLQFFYLFLVQFLYILFPRLQLYHLRLSHHLLVLNYFVSQYFLIFEIEFLDFGQLDLVLVSFMFHKLVVGEALVFYFIKNIGD
jgi:hypothetical protein